MSKRVLAIAAGLCCFLPLPSETAIAQAFITSWGSYGSGDGQLKTPQGVAVGGSGEVYVSDGDNSRIEVFTRDGSYLRQWAMPAPTYGAALNIAVDVNDNVYVGSLRDGFVYRFTNTGTLVTQWGGPGTGPGHFNFASLAVDFSGNVYVADFDNDRVQVLLPSGAFVREWGSSGSGDGQFNGPDGLAVDASGDVYVADKGNSRVQKFTNTGTYLTQWGSPGTGDGQFSGPGEFAGPVRVAIGPEGNVYVVDYQLCRVQAFSSEGAFITKWGSFGISTGQFDGPIGIAVDSFGGIYVAEKTTAASRNSPTRPHPCRA